MRTKLITLAGLFCLCLVTASAEAQERATFDTGPDAQQCFVRFKPGSSWFVNKETSVSYALVNSQGNRGMMMNFTEVKVQYSRRLNELTLEGSVVDSRGTKVKQSWVFDLNPQVNASGVSMFSYEIYDKNEDLIPGVDRWAYLYDVNEYVSARRPSNGGVPNGNGVRGGVRN